MPPKKKARLSSHAASTPSESVPEPVEETPTPMEVDSSREELTLDPWTDEQETSLFKSMVRWKPVGMHKHFRMIAISENLRNHGYTSSRDNHTRIPGIWEKLNSLYNLEALDERENDMGHSEHDEADPMGEPFYEFALLKEEYGEMTFAKRLAPDRSQSPPTLSDPVPSGRSSSNRRHSTIDDTDEPRSSPASVPGQGSVRGNRSKPKGKSQLQSVSVPVSRTRRGKAPTGVLDQGDDDELGNEEKHEGGKGTPTKASKGVHNASRAANSKSNRRKSVRRR